jgi:putative intracellular protease/amidase
LAKPYFLMTALVIAAVAKPASAAEKPKKILIIASNILDAGDADKTDARNNLWEVAPPYHLFKMHGYDVDFLSPRGGKLPFSLDVEDADPPGMIAYTIKFERFREKSDNSLRPDQIDAGAYSALFIGGGFGPLFDVARDPETLEIMRKIYERGGVLGACGHGPGSFSDVRLSNGNYLVAGKRVTGFPNSSEEKSNRSQMGRLLPFRVEDALRARGALFQSKVDLADKHDIVSDQRLVTTMFLPSCAIAAKAVIDQLGVQSAPGSAH